MKKYFKKIFDILFVKKESMGYIEKDNKKIANKTYKIIKNIGILLTAILVAYILVFVRIESIITALEKNKDLEFSISKQGIEFISEEDIANDKKKEEIIRKYTISDIDIVTINAEKIEDGMIEKNKDIFNADKNMLVITKGKVYTYENNVLSKEIDIREELKAEEGFDFVIYKNDIINFYKSYNLRIFLFILIFLITFLAMIFIIFILSIFAKAIGHTVILILGMIKVVNIDTNISYNIVVYSLIPAYIIWNLVIIYSLSFGLRKNIESLNRKYIL
jgi:hypothetical protein